MVDELTPPEDVTGLKNTIAALRNDLKQTKERYQGIDDPDAVRQQLQEYQRIKPEYEQLQQESETLKKQVNEGKVSSAIASTLAGVDPNYSDLLTSNLRSLLQVGEDGNVMASNGQSLEDLRKDYQAKYPTMFLNGSAPVPAGSGNAPSNGAPPATPAVVQRGKGGLIVGVDPAKVTGGKVKLE